MKFLKPLRIMCFAILGAGLTASGAVLAEQPSGFSDGSSIVRASVHSEHEAIGPDAPTWLAMRFAINPGWHTYWKNPGDTGAEMAVKYRGPDWATLGELSWPVPKRYISPGDLLDFVHEGTPVLLAPLRVDRDAWEEAGSPQTLRFELDCEWFVCKDVCLLGEQTLTVELAVDASATTDRAPDAKQAGLFRQARQKIPTALSETPEGVFSARFTDGRLIIDAPGATRLTFFPAKSKALALPLDSLGEGQRDGNQLEIRYRDEARDVEHLEGVLVIERLNAETGRSRTSAYEVKVPVRSGDALPAKDSPNGGPR